MVRRRTAEAVNGLRIPAQACCAMAVAQKRNGSRGAVFKAGQQKLSFNVRRSGGDPGPAGFDWVEIDFNQTHFDKARRKTGSGQDAPRLGVIAGTI